MSRINTVLLALLIPVCCSCSKPPETLVQGGYDEEEMEAAINEARSEVDRFIAELSAGNGADFAVKVPVEDNGEVEHFWLTDIDYRDGEFHGQIGNDPGIVSNVTFGQPYSVAKNEISDWMFMRDGKMHGNYTVKPLLKTMSAEQADAVRSMLADP